MRGRRSKVVIVTAAPKPGLIEAALDAGGDTIVFGNPPEQLLED